MSKYSVYVDDNFHAYDESERYLLGQFETYDEAVSAAKEIVDRFLIKNYEPGISGPKLLENYKGFGEDPFVVPADPTHPFSAWGYAAERCTEICGPSGGQKG